jgi:hypothetical protein
MGGIGTALVAAIATAIGAGIGQDIQNLFGGHRTTETSSLPTTSPPTIGSLSISRFGKHYQIVTPIFDSQQTDQQVQEVTLDLQWGVPGVACGVVNNIYQVNEALLVNKVSHVVEGSVSQESGRTLGLVQATGRLYETCGGEDLSLTFRPSALILAAKTTNLISISFPVDILATSLHPNPGSPVSIPQANASGVVSTIRGQGYLKATMTIHTNSGKKMTACEVAGIWQGNVPKCQISK